MTNKKQTYLGDGVYVESNGHHVILRTGSHDERCVNKIYLDDSVMTALLLWIKAGGAWGEKDE